MRPIIFLDDDENRTAAFLVKMEPKKEAYNIQTIKTAAETIDAVKKTGTSDLLLFLDHDLGGEVYVNSSREDCGMEVVRWIVANKPPIGMIVVHTHNVPAGTEMSSKLTEVGYSVMYIPFSTLLSQLC